MNRPCYNANRSELLAQSDSYQRVNLLLRFTSLATKRITRPFRIACAVCGDLFEPQNNRSCYCGLRCRRKAGLEKSKQGKIATRPAQPCASCGTQFCPRAKNHIYCSKRCKSREHFPKFNGAEGIHLTTVTAGAVSELVVAADLMHKGYPVFRALSPSCACDLIILIGNVPYRVEVTTAWISKTGRTFAPAKPDHTRFDLLAYYVRQSKEVLYVPDLESINASPPCSNEALADSP